MEFVRQVPILCERVRYAYRDGTLATDDVSLTLNPGDLLCLLGPNGAGKTTLIRQLTGDLRPDAGTIRVFGEDPARSPVAVKRRMGIIPQSAALFPMLSVKHHLEGFAALKGLSRRRAREAMDGLIAECDLSQLLQKAGGALSGGQQRLVLFALALLADPDILILDEPTVGLDPEARKSIWTVISRQRERGKAILLTTHYLDEAERLASRIGFLASGVMTHEGTVAEFCRQLGKSVRLVEGPGASRPGQVYLLDSVDEAQAFARAQGLVDYSVGQVSLEDVYFRLSGNRAPKEMKAA